MEIQRFYMINLIVLIYSMLSLTLVCCMEKPEMRFPLHAAVLEKNLNSVKELIASGIDVTNVDSDGQTALHIACGTGSLEIVQELLNGYESAKNKFWSGIKIALSFNEFINSHTSSDCKLPGATPLHYAAANGHTAIINLLKIYADSKQIKLDIDARDKNESTPLMWASQRGHLNTVNELIKIGCNIRLTNKYLWTALHYASCTSNVPLVETLISHRASMNAQNANDETPLFLAVKHKKQEVARALLKHRRIRPGIANKDAFSPLHIAVQQANANLVYDLLRAGINVSGTNKETPLYIALQHAYDFVTARTQISEIFAKECITFDPDDLENPDYYNQLIKKNNKSYDRAMSLNQLLKNSYPLTIVRFLINCQANPNTQIGNGISCVHLAALYRDLDLLSSCVAAGADINMENKEGYTALHLAVKKNDLAFVKKLIELGAKLDIKVEKKLGFFEGISPLIMAMRQVKQAIELINEGTSCLDMLRLSRAIAIALINAGANCNDAEILPLAVELQQRHIVYALLKRPNILINEKYNIGNTPLHIAASKGDLKLVNALLDSGADETILNKESLTPLELILENEIGNNRLKLLKAFFMHGTAVEPDDDLVEDLDSIFASDTRTLAFVTHKHDDNIETLLPLAAQIANMDFNIPDAIAQQILIISAAQGEEITFSAILRRLLIKSTPFGNALKLAIIGAVRGGHFGIAIQLLPHAIFKGALTTVTIQNLIKFSEFALKNRKLENAQYENYKKLREQLGRVLKLITLLQPHTNNDEETLKILTDKIREIFNQIQTPSQANDHGSYLELLPNELLLDLFARVYTAELK